MLVFVQPHCCIVPECKSFLILRIVHIQQVFQIRIEFSYVRFCMIQVILCNLYDFLQILFFCFTCQAWKVASFFQVVHLLLKMRTSVILFIHLFSHKIFKFFGIIFLSFFHNKYNTKNIKNGKELSYEIKKQF